MMDIASLADKERTNRKYAEGFFEQEGEMKGIFSTDVNILDSMIRKRGRLLDVAMGPGRHVKHFAAKGFEVWGNDFSKHMIREARKYVKKRKVRYTNHDMRNLRSVKKGLFDYVICMGASLGSIYRYRERQKAVTEMARVAKSGGLVFIHAHNMFEISSVEDFFNLAKIVIRSLIWPGRFEFGDVIYYHSHVLKDAYIHWFRPGELRGLMRTVGLQVVREFYLKGPNQDRLMGNSLFSLVGAGGFVFVGKKL